MRAAAHGPLWVRGRMSILARRPPCLVRRVFRLKKMNPYRYQPPLIENTFSNLIEHRRALLAACPGAGKTRMTLKVIEKFKRRFPKATIMVFAHGQTLLREQWADVMTAHSTIAHKVVEHGKDFEDINGKVLLCIPQTLFAAKKLPKIDLLITDEAHHYCDAEITKRLIERLHPKYELRLTGTPAIYVGKDEWKIEGITVQELLEYGVLTDPTIELVKANYKYDLKDYFEDTLQLRQKTRMTRDETFSTLDNVLKQLSGRLAGKKAMYICHNQKQAHDVAAYFERAGEKAILSISDLNSGTAEIESFKTDPKIKTLIVVNRGTLGFDYEGLTAIIDMSGSLNVNKLFQMLCRVVRQDKKNPNHKKYFIKLATPEMAIITHFVMSFVVSLSDPDHYYTYKVENTKNARVPVPVDYTKIVGGGHQGGANTTERQFPDLPALYTFKDIRAIKDGAITTYAITDFSTVRKLLRKTPDRKWDINEVLAVAAKCKTRWEFRRDHKPQYFILQRNNLLHLLDPILPAKYPKRDDWTVEEVLKMAKRFQSKSQFREAHHGAYKWMKAQGKLELLKFSRTKTLWNHNEALAAGLKYQTNKQLKQHQSGLHDYLRRNNLLKTLINLRGQQVVGLPANPVTRPTLAHSVPDNARPFGRAGVIRRRARKLEGAA